MDQHTTDDKATPAELRVRDEIRLLRDLLGRAAGASKPPTTADFATALTTRLQSGRVVSTNTAWRWLQGRARPNRATMARLRSMIDALNASEHASAPAELGGDPPQDITDACLRARVRILSEVLKHAPHYLERAEAVARAAETHLIVLSSYVRMSAAAAADALRGAVVAGLPSDEAAHFKSSSCGPNDEVPKGPVAKSFLEFARLFGEMHRSRIASAMDATSGDRQSDH